MLIEPKFRILSIGPILLILLIQSIIPSVSSDLWTQSNHADFSTGQLKDIDINSTPDEMAIMWQDYISYIPYWSLNGTQANGTLGASLSGSGDINGDGFSDFVIGEPGYANNTGRILVYYGSLEGPSKTPTIINGLHEGDRFGWAVSARGDVHGDGYDDVLVGAPWESGKGRVYLFSGSHQGLVTSVNTTIFGETGLQGFSLDIGGDFNGDGKDDAIIGIPGWGNYQGKFDFYIGSSTGLKFFSWGYSFSQINSMMGYRVAFVGDINGDGYDDMVGTAPYYNFDGPNQGGFMPILGADSGLVTWVQVHGTTGANLGLSITSGDFNRDGKSDFAIGAPNASAGNGSVKLMNYDKSSAGYLNQWPVIPGSGGEALGSALTSVDLDMNGFPDLVIGCPNGPKASRTGEVWHSVDNPSGDLLMPSHVWSGINQVGANFGRAVSDAGDVNADGLRELLVGSPNYTASGKADAGLAQLFQGIRRSQGIYTSKVFDSSTLGTFWDNVTIDSFKPKGTEIALSFRTGDTPQPDPNWSQWSDEIFPLQAPTSLLDIPRARYLQYKAPLRTSDINITPRLKEVEIEYTLDQRPNAIRLTPSDGTWTNSSAPIFSWNFSDPDGDEQGSFEIQYGTTPPYSGTAKTYTEKTNRTYTSGLKLSDGLWYWRVLTMDRYGLQGIVSSTGNFRIDTHPPSDGFQYLPEFMGIAGANVSWYGDDHASGVKSYDVEYSHDTIVWTTWLVGTNSNWALWTNTSAKETIYFRVRARDFAGNIGNYSDYLGSTKLELRGRPVRDKVILGEVAQAEVTISPKPSYSTIFLDLAEGFDHEFRPPVLDDQDRSVLNVTFPVVGRYNISIKASTYWDLVGLCNVSFEVTNFNLTTEPSQISVPPGTSSSVSISLATIGNFSDRVSLSSVMAAGLNGKARVHFYNTDLGPGEKVKLAVDMDENVSPGVYWLLLNGTCRGISRHLNLTVKVPGLKVQLKDRDIILPQGGLVSVPVNVTGLEFAGDVGFEVQGIFNGSGIVISFSPSTVGTGHEALMNIQVSDTTVPMTYPFKLVAKAGPVEDEIDFNVLVTKGISLMELKLTKEVIAASENCMGVIVIQNPSPFKIKEVTIDIFIDDAKVQSLLVDLAPDSRTNVSLNLSVQGLSTGQHTLKVRIVPDERFKVVGDDSITKKIYVGRKEAGMSNLMAGLIVMLIAFVVVLGAAAAYYKFRKVEEKYMINEVFLVYSDGRLVASRSSEKPSEKEKGPEDEEEMDKDVVVSMLTAIQNFVKEGFRKKSGSLNSIKYGDMNILLERSGDLYLAVVVSGQGGEPKGFRERMRQSLEGIWDEHKDVLRSWDGNRDTVTVVQAQLKELMGK
jgi:hypothetical protein